MQKKPIKLKIGHSKKYKMKNKRFALISVFEKKGVLKLAKLLIKNNINIISTGATAKHLTSKGIKCKTVESITKFKEILEGRVKTLHPKIHAPILFDRKNLKHIRLLKKLNFPIIDFVIVNLYPFEKIKKINDVNKYINMIDIGGSALLRSSAKNYQYVSAICNPNDYSKLIDNLNKNNGTTTIEFRKKMAEEVFKKTSKYDSIIAKWFNKKMTKEIIQKNYKKINLNYGENPHQKSYFLREGKKTSILDSQIHGKKLSHNNILDSDSAFNCINEFNEPACVIIKHNNPCGVATAININKAFLKAYSTDPKSAYGGIIAFNRIIDSNLAKLISKYFFEIILAKDFSKDSLEVFARKKKTILIITKNIKINKKNEIKSINNGFLVQEKNLIKFNKNDLQKVSFKKGTKSQIDDLIFSYKVCKHVKSNAIVLSKNKRTIGIGAGQMSRIDATKLSLQKANTKDKKEGFVAASDAFFPFIDSIKLLIKNNCKSIVQAKGSINDSKIVSFANKKNISLYFSNYRFFKH